MKTLKIILGLLVIAVLSGCITYEKIENGKKSGFSTNPGWWIDRIIESD